MLLFYTQGRMCSLTRRVLEEAGAQPTRDMLADWDLYVPLYGPNFSREIANLLPSRTDQWIAGIPGSWRIANKESLWGGLCGRYGRHRARFLLPETWRLTLPEARDLLLEQHSPGQTYIFKNPMLQRRTGLRLRDTLDDLDGAVRDGFTLVQPVMPDLLLVGGHRFNLRLYFLLIRREGRYSIWLHRQGRCVCAPEPFTGDRLHEPAVVTRSVGSDQLKPGLPFTYAELLKALPAAGLSPARTAAHIDNILFRIATAVIPKLRNSWRLSDNPAFQLFGVDFVITEQGGVRLIEMNSGPELKPLCRRDRALKKRMVRDIFALTGLLPQARPSGFRALRAIEL